jgi:5'-nucleotidase
MKILISNDDGYQAPGIVALHDALKTLDGVEVEVVAPEHNNSAKSNALTLHSPLYVHKAANGFRYVNGTPADCVHIALTGLLGYRPDLVVSGINNGANMGDDTIYSGTVGAAMEGFLFGIPAMAVSQVDKGWGEIEAAAHKTREIVAQMMAQNLVAEAPWLLNINIPNMPLQALRPLKLCRLGRRHAAERVIVQESPRGDVMYWIGGAGAAKDEAEGTDFHATAQGHVSVTPLKVDLTDHDNLGYWAQTASRGDRWFSGPAAVMQRRPGFPARLDGAGGAASKPAPAPGARQCAPMAGSAPRCWAGFGAVRARMVQKLAAGGIDITRVLQAMGEVERHRFVDSALVNQAYEDTSLPIGMAQTISKPSVVARMCELLLGAECARAAGWAGCWKSAPAAATRRRCLSLLAREVYTSSASRPAREGA